MEKWSFSRKEPWGICSGVGNDNHSYFLQLWNLRLDLLQPCNDWVLFWAWRFSASKIATNSSQISNSRLDASVIGVMMILVDLGHSLTFRILCAPCKGVGLGILQGHFGERHQRSFACRGLKNHSDLIEWWQVWCNWLNLGLLLMSTNALGGLKGLQVLILRLEYVTVCQS